MGKIIAELYFEHLRLRLLHSLAALILFYRGEWNGEKIPLSDSAEVLAFIRQAWKSDSLVEVVHTILSRQEFWGSDLT